MNQNARNMCGVHPLALDCFSALDRPVKVQKVFPDAKAHPDPIMESSSMSGVEPPDITYQHHLQVRNLGVM